MKMKNLDETLMEVDGVKNLEVSRRISLDQRKVYTSRISDLLEIKLSEERGKVFNGCPIERGSGGLKWFRPGVIIGKNGLHYGVHFLYVNCEPREINDEIEYRVVVVASDDMDLKMQNLRNSSFADLNSLLDGKDGRPTLVVRLTQYSNINLNYMPINFGSFESILAQIEENLIGAVRDLGLKKFSYENLIIRGEGESLNCELNLNGESMKIIRVKQVETAFGKFYVQDIYLLFDDWKIYQVVSVLPFEELIEGRKNGLGVMPKVRIDSGCDCGQLYGDGLCECLVQFQRSMKEVFEEACAGNPFGYIVHIPLQDGRGYGNAGKSETECYKNKLGGGKIRPELSNVLAGRAAELLYRDDSLPLAKDDLGNLVKLPLDIRTYDGAAKIMGMLSPQGFRIITSSRQKINDVVRVLGLLEKDILANRISAVGAGYDGFTESARSHLRDKLEVLGYLDSI